MNYRLSYPFKIWLTSTLVGTLLFVIYFSISTSAPFEGIFTLFFFGLFTSLGTSIPAFFILWLSIALLTRTTLSTKLTRMIVALIGTICCVLLFNTFGVNYAETSDMVLIGAYSLPLIVAALLYPLKPMSNSHIAETTS